MTIKYDQLTGGVKNHIESTTNPHDVTAHQIGANAILAEIDEYGSTTVGWDKVDKTGSSLADLATKNYSDLSSRPGDDNFHSLTEVSSSVNSDEVLLYVSGTTNDYRKITKQNLLSGISVSSNKIYESNTKAEVHDTGSDGYFWVETEGVERFRINPSGNIGINQSSPTAKLHVAAGTSFASSAPIKLTSGTAMSSPEDGAVEYHNSHLYFTIGSTRYQIDQQGGGGFGDVVGPVNATNEAIVRFDTTTGKLIQNSLVIIGDDGYISIPSGQKYKINGVNLSAIDVGAEPTLTKGTISSNTTSVISITNGSNSTVGPNVSITINKASASLDGYLGKDNWSTFNSKENSLTFQHSLTRSVNIINLVNDSASPGNSQYYGTNGSGTKGWYYLPSGLGDVVGPVSSTDEGIVRFDGITGKLIQNSLVIIGDDGYVSIPSGQKYKINGVDLSATDVGAEPTLDKTNLTETASSILTITNGSNSVIGTSPVTIQVKKASISQDGYLGKDDWDLFNKKASLTTPVFTSKITIGVASSSTGSIELKGLTSGTCTITVPSIAGTPTYVLPASYGSAGQVLTDAAGNGILSWTTASGGVSDKIYELNTKAEVHDTGSDGYFWIETDGVERFRINSSGVGISQNSPTAKLHIAAGSVSANSAPIKLTSGTAMSTPEDGSIEYHSSHLYFTIGSTRYQIDQQSGGASDKIYELNTKAEVHDTGSDGYFWVETEGVERFRINPSGNIGVNQSSPTARLHLPAGTATINTAPLKFVSGIALTSPEDGAIEYHSSHLYFTIGSTRYQIDQQSASGNKIFELNTKAEVHDMGSDGYFWVETEGVERFRINPSGYVGIGQTSPTARLHLPAGTSTTNTAPLKFVSGVALATPEDGSVEYHNSHLYFTIDSTRYQLDQQSANGNKIYELNTKGEVHDTGSDGYFWIETDGVERFRVNSSGVGIGQNSPTAKLHIAAGSASANSSPIKLTSGTAMSIPEDGAIEYHSSHLYFTIDSTRYQLDQQGGSYNKIYELNTKAEVHDTGSDGYFWIETEGVERFRVNPSGNVGISQASPTARLHLPAGTATINTSPLKFTSGVALSAPEDGAVEYHSSHLYFTIGSTRYQLDQQAGGSGNKIYELNTKAEVHDTGSDGYFWVETEGVERFRINPSGNIGVNQPSPTARLHLPAGTASASSAPLKLTSGTAMSLPEDGAIEYHNSHLYFTIDSTRYQIDQQSGGASDKIYELNTKAEVHDTGSDGYFWIETEGVERFRVNPSGNIGINQSSPTAKLHLPAGTATVNTAPLKFVSGTALATPEDGAMEYNSSHLYFTIGSTRYQIDQQSGSGGNKIEENNTKLEVHDIGSDGYMFFDADGVRKIRFDANGTYVDGYMSTKGLVEPVSSKSADYTTTLNDHTLLVTTASSDVTITLSSTAAKVGQIYVIKKVDSGSGYVILSPSSGTIDGQTTHSIKFFNDSRYVQFDGTNWKIITPYSSAFVWKGTTTNSDITEIFIDGIVDNVYDLTSNSTEVFELTAIARNNAGNKTKVWTISVVTTTDSSGVSSIVGTPDFVVVAQSDISGGTTTWQINVHSEDEDALHIIVSGQTDTTIQWVVSN